jgi:hypothetical protein
MRKFASITVLAALALGLSACGGSDNNAFGGTGSGSGGTITGGGTGGTGGSTTPTFSMGSGSGSSFAAGMLGITSTTLSAGGSTSVEASIVDQTGTLFTGAPVTVTFNSPCAAAGRATIVATGGAVVGAAAGAVTTTTGIAQATYTAKGCSGSDVITATASVTSSAGATSLTATGTVTIAAAAVGSIQFVSATPSTIGLKGTGLNETSTVIFKVVDSSGGPRAGATVTFKLNTTVGGIGLSQPSAVSGSDGTVQTVVSAGTAHTSVVVSATIASPALTTNSSVLAITTGLPASAGFSIATGKGSSGNSCPNVEAFNIDGVTIPITARLSDRYNNPAPDGTAVAFTTNGGHIVGNCTTPSAAANTGDGTCTATWTSANPRPALNDDIPKLKAAGRATVFATAIGEESFTDANGNGFYDPGESFSDLGEPFRDDNENATYDVGEYFLDFNHDGVRNPADGHFKGITCTGSTPTSTCSTATLGISASSLIVMSTSNAQITLLAPATPLSFGENATIAIQYNVQDLNGNPMAAGTTVTVSASSAVGTVSQPTFNIPCSTALGGETFTSFLTTAAAPGSGTLSITVVSPSGATTVFNVGATVT